MSVENLLTGAPGESCVCSKMRKLQMIEARISKTRGSSLDLERGAYYESTVDRVTIANKEPAQCHRADSRVRR